MGDFVGLDCVLPGTVGLRFILPAVDAPGFQVFRLGGLLVEIGSCSFLDLRRNGLFEKKPDRFF